MTGLTQCQLSDLIRAMGEHERTGKPPSRPRPGSSLVVGDVIWADEHEWIVTSAKSGSLTLAREVKGRLIFRQGSMANEWEWIRRLPRTTPPPLPSPPMAEPKHVARVLSLMRVLGVTVEDLAR